MLSTTKKFMTGTLFLAAASIPGIASAVSISGEVNHVWSYTGGLYVGVKPESAYGSSVNYYCWVPNSYAQMGNAVSAAAASGDNVSMGCNGRSWTSGTNRSGGTATSFHLYNRR